MNPDQLKETLQKLHGELAAPGQIDPEVRTLLKQLASDIDAALAAGSPTNEGAAADSDSSESLLHRLKDVRSQFEESHPDLAMTLGRVADALSQLGI